MSEFPRPWTARLAEKSSDKDTVVCWVIFDANDVFVATCESEVVARLIINSTTQVCCVCASPMSLPSTVQLYCSDECGEKLQGMYSEGKTPGPEKSN